MPGWVAVVDRQGHSLSPATPMHCRSSGKGIPIGSAGGPKPGGRSSPLPSTRRKPGGTSWPPYPGTSSLAPCSVSTGGCWGSSGSWASSVSPSEMAGGALKGPQTEVSTLHLGRDIPKAMIRAVHEIRRLRVVLQQLARGAVERAEHETLCRRHRQGPGRKIAHCQGTP